MVIKMEDQFLSFFIDTNTYDYSTVCKALKTFRKDMNLFKKKISGRILVEKGILVIKRIMNVFDQELRRNNVDLSACSDVIFCVWYFRMMDDESIAFITNTIHVVDSLIPKFADSHKSRYFLNFLWDIRNDYSRIAKFKPLDECYESIVTSFSKIPFDDDVRSSVSKIDLLSNVIYKLDNMRLYESIAYNSYLKAVLTASRSCTRTNASLSLSNIVNLFIVATIAAVTRQFDVCKEVVTICEQAYCDLLKKHLRFSEKQQYIIRKHAVKRMQTIDKMLSNRIVAIIESNVEFNKRYGCSEIERGYNGAESYKTGETNKVGEFNEEIDKGNDPRGESRENYGSENYGSKNHGSENHGSENQGSENQGSENHVDDIVLQELKDCNIYKWPLCDRQTLCEQLSALVSRAYTSYHWTPSMMHEAMWCHSKALLLMDSNIRKSFNGLDDLFLRWFIDPSRLIDCSDELFVIRSLYLLLRVAPDHVVRVLDFGENNENIKNLLEKFDFFAQSRMRQKLRRIKDYTDVYCHIAYLLMKNKTECLQTIYYTCSDVMSSSIKYEASTPN